MLTFRQIEEEEEEEFIWLFLVRRANIKALSSESPG